MRTVRVAGTFYTVNPKSGVKNLIEHCEKTLFVDDDFSVDTLNGVMGNAGITVNTVIDADTGHCYFSRYLFEAVLSNGIILACEKPNKWKGFFKNVKASCEEYGCSATIYCINNGKREIVRECGQTERS